MAGKQQIILYSLLLLTFITQLIYLIARWSNNGCMEHTTKEDFDVEAYMGVWYEFARSENIPFETGSCITANYELESEDSRKVNVVNTQ